MKPHIMKLQKLLIVQLFYLFIIFPIQLKAQYNYLNKVYLKNGSIINGTLIEEYPDSLIIIRTADGNKFSFNFEEIEKLTNESINDRFVSIEIKKGNVIDGVIVEMIPQISLKFRTGDDNLFVFKMEEIEKVVNNYVSKSSEQDRITLKDGSLVYGFIIEQKPNISIKIQLPDNNVIVYELQKIKNIVYKEANAVVRQKEKPGKKIICKDEGIYNLLSINIGHDLDPNGYSLGISNVLGYHFNKKLYYGIGVGYNYSHCLNYSIPLFIDLRMFLFKNCKSTPFISINPGYLIFKSEKIVYDFSWDQFREVHTVYPGSLFCNIEVGFQFRILKKFFWGSINMYNSKWFTYQEQKENNNGQWVQNDTKTIDNYFGNLSLKLGVRF
ncbi:MAG: hypothetical protein HY738_18915 [Bacteroidia bacterium]|nr:hypothetical protein [Bacteroidia bacterium]